MADPPETDPHTSAILDRLRIALPAAVTVHDGGVPATPGQTYAVVYPGPGLRERSALVAVSDHLTVTFQVTCVGSTPLQTRQVCDQVCAALIDNILAVPGRQCWPVTQDEGMPPIARNDRTRDPSIARPRFWLTPEFRLQSTPA